MASVITTSVPIQIPSDAGYSVSSGTHVHNQGTYTVTHTISIPKVTKNGTAGSVTFINGVPQLATYVAPT